MNLIGLMLKVFIEIILIGRLTNVAKLKVIHDLIWYYFFKISIQFDIWKNLLKWKAANYNERSLLFDEG